MIRRVFIEIIKAMDFREVFTDFLVNSGIHDFLLLVLDTGYWIFNAVFSLAKEFWQFVLKSVLDFFMLN